MTSLLSRKEISKHLKLSSITTYRLTKSGVIPSYRVGKQLRYNLPEVQAALKQQYKPKDLQDATADTN